MMNVQRPPEPTFAQPAAVYAAPFQWFLEGLQFVRRRWRTILLTTVTSIGLGVAYVQLATPQYAAFVNLVIDTRQGTPFRQQALVNDSQSDNAIVESQVEVLRSRGIAAAVVAKLDLAAPSDEPATVNYNPIDLVTGWIRSVLTPPAPGANDAEMNAVEDLLRRISVRRVGLSYVIEVGATTPDPQRSATLANAIVDAYVARQFEAKFETTRRASGWLQDRIVELRTQALAADRAVQEYKARNNIVDTDRGQMDEQQLGELNSQLTSARGRASEARSRLDRIQAIIAGGIANASVTDELQNTVVIRLRQQYLDAARRESEWSTRYGPNHVAAVNLRNEMAELQRSIRNELRRISETYRSDLEVARSNEAATQQQLNELISNAAATNASRTELRSLQSSADTSRLIYENFLQRYTQVVQDQSFPISDVRVVTPATPPLRHAWPQKTLILALATLLGLGLGFVLAFIRETMDRGFRTPAQIKSTTGLDCIGMLPRLSRREMAAGRTALRDDPVQRAATRTLSPRPSPLRHVVANPTSQFSEVMRDLRGYVARQRVRSRDVKVIGMVSVMPEEGKSTVSANLAQVLAQAGERVALLDWDLRKPTLTRGLVPANRPGFLDVARGEAELAEVTWRDPETGLTFLPGASGKLGPDLTGVLYSDRTRRLMDELRATHDYVVVDLPALGPVQDAHAVSHLIDGFIAVIEWGRVDQDLIVEHLSRLGIDGSEIIGATLNKVDLDALKRYVSPAAVYNGTVYGYGTTAS